MQFAKKVFLSAGIFGLILVLPLFVMEANYAKDGTGLVSSPEFYYGFAGVTLAWQIAFILISRDPVRFRPLMPAAMAEKFFFVLAIAWLASQGRVGPNMISAAALDFIWGVLFLLAWRRTA
jgi:hypothetical protein